MRDYKITTRFEEQEYRLIEKIAKVHNIPKSTITHLAILSAIKQEKFLNEIAKLKQKKADRELLYQIKKLGTNMNQIARALNTLKKAKLKKELKKEIERLIKETQEVLEWLSLRK